MFNIDLPHKSATPMKHHSCTKAGLKLTYTFVHPSWGLGGKNYCILRPVLWMQ